MEQISSGLVFVLDAQTAEVIKGKYKNKRLEPIPISTSFYLPTTILEDNDFESTFEILGELPVKLLTIETLLNNETNLLENTTTLTDPE